MDTNIPSSVRIVEVGPRDGLQNEKQPIDIATRVQLINMLSAAGLNTIEAGSFVNPAWVPQMAGSEDVFSRINRLPGVRYVALVPNSKGFERAASVNANEVAIFAAASEGFSQKNINCSIEESLARFKPVMSAAKTAGIPVRGYISCVISCPYDGEVSPQKVAEVSERLLAMGCYEISLGDTVGTGTPASVTRMLDAVLKIVPADKLAVHFHDTYGQALANIYASLQRGIAVIDSSIAGLGGCPYAKGAAGNVATEDLVYMLNGLGIQHGVDLNKLIAADQFISEKLNRQSGSKVALAASR
ncbi:hydroxymethylglutaryl-CoA lyase [gamma proteobacterium BDW918]|uniref:hydroxymethylglutaryl-CoA lyase n=1 Tax=Zhongshania aliphaticivorans TaxID=1470434 RepID=A0A127M6Z6_9GAMM|nr:hydroxymethylglutaryl-CoA lyase [Zhongshania aliphaticivorans]AMO69007.1 hydroxymethylglutaryl-CoA lyase [Zhongshania aliphaticivorans]EIF43731.1 hydroxymethylglutaryl-CoA lyase [gamma proteobacterium BDW918]